MKSRRFLLPVAVLSLYTLATAQTMQMNDPQKPSEAKRKSLSIN